jgi:hypothetical protein
MDPTKIQELIKQKREDIGQRFANPPTLNTANDSEILSLRNNQADKIKQLFEHDTKLAPVYMQPQEAGGPHAEGYQAPEQRIIDPMIGLKAASTQTQATAGELGDIGKAIEKRKDFLMDIYEKAMAGFTMGLQMKKMELDSLNDEFSQILKLKELEEKQNENKQKAKDKEASEAFFKMLQAQIGEAGNTTQLGVGGGGTSATPPMYAPRDPNQIVSNGGTLWKYNTKTGKWDNVSTATSGRPPLSSFDK